MNTQIRENIQMKGGKFRMEKKKFNKKLLIPLFVVLAIGLVVATVYVVSLTVNVSVNEPISATPLDLSVSGVYPSEVTEIGSFTISNDATVDEPADITWVPGIMTATEYDVLVSVDGSGLISIKDGSTNLNVDADVDSVVTVYVVYEGTDGSDTIVGEVQATGTLTA